MNTPPPPVLPNGNHKIWSILCHLSGIIGLGFVLPLVVYLVMRDQSPYVACNARTALNFHLSVILYGACCLPLVFIFIGIPLLALLALVALVLAIIATVKAVEGGCYEYPLSIPFVR